MESEIGIIGIILIILNSTFSYKGFTNSLFFENYKFEVDKILIKKDYIRLLSSGFLHANWTHLIFNMLSLYAFDRLLEVQIGTFYFVLIYLASLVSGNLLALFIHRNHSDYSAIGSSGAVCGIIFASIALFPGLGISLFGLPFSIPSWLYGIIYIIYTIFGIKSNKDTIGYEAHLGGTLAGMFLAVLIQPSSLTENYLPILVITVPTLVFIYLIITKPHILILDTFYSKKSNPKNYDIDHLYNEQKINKQKELDKLLDKINQKSIQSLSKAEKQRLEELSK